jgi:nucleotide-binding universal stress UspA family protein
MLNCPIILACTDFSSHSDVTLRTANKIRKATKGKLYVAHVSEIVTQLDINTNTLAPSMEQQTVSELVHRNVEDKLKNQINGLEIEAEPLFALGVPASGILKIIEDKKVDLLVMGHGGAGAIERLLLGGLTQKMMRQSPVPVWVVKKEVEINRVVGLVDDSDAMAPVISSAEEISYLLNSDLEIVSVWQDYPMTFASYTSEFSALYMSTSKAEQNKMVGELKKKISELVLDKEKTKIRVEVTQETKIAHALVNILNEDHANLAVMGSHSKNFLDRILLGSETKRVLELFEGNIVVLPSKQES